MDQTEFTAEAPGTLVAITGGWSFVPAPPPRWVDISPATFARFDSARGALGEFVGHARLVPDEYLITDPLLTIEAIQSNRIEGTHTLITDVLRQHVTGREADGEQADRNLEVLLYRAALRLGERWVRDGLPLNQAFIRALHAELLREGRGAAARPGAYRDRQVAIGARTPAAARYVPPPSGEVPSLMADLEAFLTERSALPALLSCAVAHYQLEAIHPFEDGNGRIGRLLIPLYLQAAGVIPAPILYLSAYFEAHADAYYDRLKAVSTQGDWDGWFRLFLEAVEFQARDSRERVVRILSLREAFQARVREQTRSQAALAAVDLIVSQIFVTIPDLQRFANCQYNTAKAAIRSLEDLGVLVPVPGTFPATWAATDLIEEVYYGSDPT